MKLLADAHISRAMVGYLQNLGHEVLHAEVLEPRLPDREILQRASEEQRIILTADKDFGELVFRQLRHCPGIVLLRFKSPSESARLEILKRLWRLIEANAPGHFLVVSEKTVKRSQLPRPQE